MTLRQRKLRGNALIEFAIASAVLLPVMLGTFRFGYSFYTYNLLESAVSNGARYASTRVYRNASSASVTKVKTAIQNMVVYGSPSGGTIPVARGLTTSHVVVTYTVDSNQVPKSVKVAVSNFTLDAVVSAFTLTNKPVVTYPFVGRYAPNESEP